ncbi:hypothetical protein [Limibacterium fermenti]|uniref:hypothetical protein n=1 Tax=Limibacterium fermenti TaxID=3229863 RepID=UPI003A770475
MKAFNFLILLSTSILLFAGCDKNDCDCGKGDKVENFQLTPDYLKQTIWKGRYRNESKNEIIREGYINIQFSTDKRGEYEYKPDNDKEPTFGNFQYQISNKLFIITADWYPPLAGDWLIKSQSKTKIILVQDAFVEDGVSKNMELNLVEL